MSPILFWLAKHPLALQESRSVLLTKTQLFADFHSPLQALLRLAY